MGGFVNRAVRVGGTVRRPMGAGSEFVQELLLDEKTLEGIHFFRRALVQQKIEESTETVLARLSKTKTNAEFLKLIAR